MERGTMVLACRHEDLSWEAGGYDEAGAEWMRALLTRVGVEVLRVFDGAAEAREKLPPGTRVIAARKHWGSPLGVVVDGGYGVNGQGATLLAEFDGRVSEWPARWLEPVALAREG